MLVLCLYFGHIPFICFLYPLSDLLLDGLLGLPLGSFSFGSYGDLLDISNFSGHHVYRPLLITGLDRALATIVTFLSTIVAYTFRVLLNSPFSVFPG